MPDNLTPSARVKAMSRIGTPGTSIEQGVRKAVWAQGFRYRKDVRNLPGKPDLVFAKYRVAVFVHGCFWHRHLCGKSQWPKSNRVYWRRKLASNVLRDARNERELVSSGWRVVTVWECEVDSGITELITKLEGMRASQE